MTTETRRRIRAYKKALPELRERVIAVALLLAMSVSMLASASFAWITLSAAPEVSGMQTTVAANGNLEIALAQGSISQPAVAPGESMVGDSSASTDQTIVGANVTWGNLVNVSDPTYGLSNIALRPALLSDYNLTEYPLNGATYGGDGRVVTTNDRYVYASYLQVGSTDKYAFFAGDDVNYGVRAISSVAYENVVGNVRIDNYRETTKRLYDDAQSYYGQIVSDTPNSVNTLAAPNVTCISALEGLVTVFAQDKLNEMGLGNGEGTKTSCSPYLWYLYQMMLLLEEALEKEGKAILEMANWQAYAATDRENTFTSIDFLTSKTTAQLADMGVKITTLESYKKSLNTLRQCITEMQPMAEKCKNPDAPEQTYYWEDIASIVGKLVQIDTATINGYKLSALGASNALDAIKSSEKAPAPVVVKDGLLTDIEKRMVSANYRTQANVKVTVKAKVIITIPMDVYGIVYTGASKPSVYTPDYTKDMAYSESLQPGSKGTPVAKDTYGLALDLWVRTNYPNTILTLEGSVKYEEVRDTITVGGNTYDLYTITTGEEGAETEVALYQANGTWYYANTQTEVAAADLEGKTPEEKFTKVIVGYEGENRVWEDWRDLLESGYIEQDATTQGAGSCFVFYADTPTEQAKIKEMLQAFNVAFINQAGKLLGTAKLNVANAYANQGKVTVPLEVDSGVQYTDGEENRFGITRLVQNTPTLVTAIIYLNGSDLRNENVLANGELQGQLNIQFGTDTTLIAPDNEELQSQSRTITAELTVGSETITNGIIGDKNNDGEISGDEGLEYVEKGHKATVTLTVEGEKPERISGYFVRVINATQGTRGESQQFTYNAETDKWVAEFTLTNPGTYAFDTLIVDGVQYTLHDGSEQSGMNSYYEANRPKVHIKGLKIASVRVDEEPGTKMYTETSKSLPVTVKIDSAVEPKQVSALFFNEDDTRQFTAILSYDAANQAWVGEANISSSGTYTLKYVTVDGVPLDAPATGSYTLYLGLTARVSTSLPTAQWKYIYDEDTPVQLPMLVQVYDDANELIGNLTGVELWYDNVISPAAMTWTGSRYEGTLDATEDGTMSFARLKLGNIGVISKVSNPPVFEALNTRPVEYQTIGLTNATSKVHNAIGTAEPARIQVELDNAKTAVVWAKMVNSNGNDEALVLGVHGSGDQQNTLIFDVPKTDGTWTVTKLYAQNCFGALGENNVKWYDLGEGDPRDDNSVVFTLSAEDQEKSAVDVVVTYQVAVTIGDVTKTYKSTDNKSDEIVTVNLTEDGASTFLEGRDTGMISVSITDYQGRLVTNAQIKDPLLEVQHNQNTTRDYGGYTGASGEKITFSNVTMSDGTATFGSMTLKHAGEYNTTTFKVNVEGSVIDIKVKPKFTITSKAPYVKFTATNPDVNTGFDVAMKKDNPQKADVQQGIKNSISADGYSATCYYQAKNDGCDCDGYNASKVTVGLMDIGENFDSATCTIESNGTAKDVTFTFQRANLNAEGKVFNEQTLGASGETRTYLGTDALVERLFVTVGESQYTFELVNPLKITLEY